MNVVSLGVNVPVPLLVQNIPVPLSILGVKTIDTPVPGPEVIVVSGPASIDGRSLTCRVKVSFKFKQYPVVVKTIFTIPLAVS